jgi:GNAT superfamily N-acetyltransferase
MANDKESLRVRDMKMDDLDGVAELHKHCFSNETSIFSALSNDTLKRYYAMYVQEPESYAAVLEDTASGQIVGFTTGTSRPGIQKRFFKRYYFEFFSNVIKGLLTSKAVWKSLWSRFFKKNEINLGEYDSVLANAGVPAPKGVEDLCMVIGVHKDFRGRGNAARLLNYYVTKVFEKGAVRIRGAVLTRNIASMNFFKHQGWEIRPVSDTYVSIWIDRPENKSN